MNVFSFPERAGKAKWTSATNRTECEGRWALQEGIDEVLGVSALEENGWDGTGEDESGWTSS